MFTIKSFVFSPVQENTYVLYNEHKNAIIIDPGCYFTAEEESLKTFIDEKELIPKILINTHCHLDHVFGNVWVNKTYNLIPHIHPQEEQMLQLAPQAAIRWGLPFDSYTGALQFVHEGGEIILDNDVLQILLVPGHSPGHICLYCKEQGFLMGGDVLFNQSIGRTDLPFCNHELLIQGIKEKLFALPKETVVYPGHGIKTTIGFEQRNNPFLV